MPADSSYAHLIAELGLALGITGLAPSDEGICQLVFDGRLVVQVVHVGAHGLVLLSCRIADHGLDAPQAERMARANFLQAGRGPVLCAAPDGRPHMQVALELSGCTAGALCPVLESLLDQAESWSRTQAHAADTPGARDPAVFLQSV
ncbi:type III secretion system chaperone [Castellaniella defragrans]|uniref:type III secretion system chaperone n=1 Tax=Castellaniella defragrans TaxID=75697 RepID=UPI0023F3D419|nr:type III secretion system chaperone [Castellaniella defragrans]